MLNWSGKRFDVEPKVLAEFLWPRDPIGKKFVAKSLLDYRTHRDLETTWINTINPKGRRGRGKPKANEEDDGKKKKKKAEEKKEAKRPSAIETLHVFQRQLLKTCFMAEEEYPRLVAGYTHLK